MSKQFLEPKSSGRRVKVDLHLSNYATKADFKYVAGIYLLKFFIKS